MSTSSVIDEAQLQHLQSWVGRSETHREVIRSAPLCGLHALLDREGPPPKDGDAVPPLGRWLYFLPQAAQADIAEDGHPKKGGFLPPVPLPRRMWAGGRLQWESGNPLRVGDEATLVSSIQSVQHKAGRSGELVFVVVRHEVSNAHGVCLSEEQDIVYRGAADQAPSAPLPTPVLAPTDEQFSRVFEPTPPALFRYSALTFNAHRIHYDRPYATEVEGYAGLVVHGPLIATLMVDLVERQCPGSRVSAFEFKAVRPTLDLHPFELCAKPIGEGVFQVWGRDAEGGLTMQGQVSLLLN
ncbi:MAG: hypothetical protein RL357_322 [Pseudomonadota bacterium]